MSSPVSTAAKPELAKVRLIGQILVDTYVIVPEQNTQVIEEINRKKAAAERDKNVPKPGFWGEEAIALGIITQEQLNEALRTQARDMAAAAMADIYSIIETRVALVYPAWQKPHWGNGPENNPVNTAITNPTALDAATAAANLAKLIVLLANERPGIAAEVQAGVNAAQQLTLLALNRTKMTGASIEEVSLESENTSLNLLKSCLSALVKVAPNAPHIEAYINARLVGEIMQVVAPRTYTAATLLLQGARSQVAVKAAGAKDASGESVDSSTLAQLEELLARRADVDARVLAAAGSAASVVAAAGTVTVGDLSAFDDDEDSASRCPTTLAAIAGAPPPSALLAAATSERRQQGRDGRTTP